MKKKIISLLLLSDVPYLTKGRELNGKSFIFVNKTW